MEFLPVATHPAEAPVALSVAGLTAGYRAVLALEDVSFTVPRGALTALIGPNGAGKSTLFLTLLGVLKPWKGTIQVMGQPADHCAGLFGYMPQGNLVDWDFPVTVADVVAMGRYAQLGPGRRPGAADRTAVERALGQVGMTDLRTRPIGALSGGQRQRVFLARALAQEAPILLLDEPVSGVDTLSQQAIMGILQRLAADGTTIIVATHDLASAAEHFSYVLCLNRRFIAAGAPDTTLTEAALNATYNSRMVLVRVEGKLYAVDTGHHG
ncbi:MAG TPA: metal ABC transporter ATP-binding protein [Chloroflexota bacterium]|jgi:ABC-type Mn2+/Zn2+ transport system ATPase subunit